MDTHGMSAADKLYVDSLMQKHPDQILHPNLYLGNLTHAQDLPHLLELQIKIIIQLSGASTPPPFPEYFTYLPIEIGDSEAANISSIFNITTPFIEANLQHRKILVHCNAGVSRSASVVIAFLMSSKQMSYSEAFGFVKKRRPCIGPNEGFVKQLLELEEKLKK